MYAQAEENRKNAIIENIYSIIDTKIQYSKYNLKRGVSKLQTEGSQLPHSPFRSLDWSEKLDNLLKTLEKNTQEVQKLLFIRTKVNHVNVDQIYDLVLNENIEELSIEKLKNML